MVRAFSALSGELWDDERLDGWIILCADLNRSRLKQPMLRMARAETKHPWVPATLLNHYEAVTEDERLDTRPVMGLLPGETTLPPEKAKERLAAIRKLWLKEHRA